MQPFLEEKREEIAELCRTHHVKRLAVFGSAVRDDFDPERSDVDLLVDFEDMPIEIYATNKWDLQEHLVSKLGRDVDLVTRKYVNNPYLLRRIAQDERDLYAA